MSEVRINTKQRDKCKNVYIDLLGCLRRLPFKTDLWGMWYYDGQVFYQRRGVES